ncbi:MAG: allophanate hydrolase subunit 1 [Armatimonadetes bacterium]|nr:allophanate hydrolase subunit 1 [Armatimonadota bacterium]
MRIEPLGDAAFIVRDIDFAPAFVVAARVERLNLPGVLEVSASYDTLGVYVDPSEFDLEALQGALEQSTPYQQGVVGKLHEVPVCYDLGEDLESSASELDLSPDDLVRHHTSVEYTCYAVGFSPGFPYLGYLPSQIAGLGRLAAPRLMVPNGAVAVAGRQTGIYPGGRPGGWRLLGITPLEIVNMSEDYFPISAGDRVAFRAIGLRDYKSLQGERL